MESRILFVDDDTEILAMVDQYLGLQGYSVQTVDNGIDALGIVKENDIDIVFTDYKMPEFNGLELLAAIKKYKPDTEVIIITDSIALYPKEDYEWLVKEHRARRVFPAAPEFSLLVTKPLNKLPHGGGRRLEEGSYEYQLLTRWIEGAPSCTHISTVEAPPGVTSGWVVGAGAPLASTRRHPGSCCEYRPRHRPCRTVGCRVCRRTSGPDRFQ